MRMVLENVQDKHYQLLLQMAEALQFKVVEVEPSEEEVDAALGRAIEAGKSEGRLNEQEQVAFETWLSKSIK